MLFSVIVCGSFCIVLLLFHHLRISHWVFLCPLLAFVSFAGCLDLVYIYRDGSSSLQSLRIGSVRVILPVVEYNLVHGLALPSRIPPYFVLCFCVQKTKYFCLITDICFHHFDGFVLHWNLFFIVYLIFYSFMQILLQ